jgi:DNA-binding MarR family transcriptional regulator
MWTDHLYQGVDRPFPGVKSIIRSGIVGDPGHQSHFPLGLATEGKVRATKLVSWLRNARSLRTRVFDAELFGEPAWDILLDLYDAELRQVRTKISSVCIESHIPRTTSLRWLKAMENRGLVQRRDDPNDARRIFVSLTPSAIGVMDALFEAMAAQLPDLQSSS